MDITFIGIQDLFCRMCCRRNFVCFFVYLCTSFEEFVHRQVSIALIFKLNSMSLPLFGAVQKYNTIYELFTSWIYIALRLYIIRTPDFCDIDICI